MALAGYSLHGMRIAPGLRFLMNLCAKKVDVPLELHSQLLEKMQEHLEKGPPSPGLTGESPWQKSGLKLSFRDGVVCWQVS